MFELYSQSHSAYRFKKILNSIHNFEKYQMGQTAPELFTAESESYCKVFVIFPCFSKPQIIPTFIMTFSQPRVVRENNNSIKNLTLTRSKLKTKEIRKSQNDQIRQSQFSLTSQSIKTFKRFKNILSSCKHWSCLNIFLYTAGCL